MASGDCRVESPGLPGDLSVGFLCAYLLEGAGDLVK